MNICTIELWKEGKTLEIEIKLLEQMAKKKIRHLTDLSKESGVTVQSLYNITNRKNEGMRLDTIAKLCAALDCEIEDLIVIKK
jgi:putative transcriptional regulator